MALGAGITPVFQGGPIISRTVSASVTAGKLVETSSAAGKVATAASASTKVIGVALQTGTADLDVIPVCLGGIFRLKAKGAVTAGDKLVASTDGFGDVSTAVVNTTGTVNEATVEAAINYALAVVGVALEDIADGASGLVRIDA